MLFLKKENLILRAINFHITIYYRMEEMSKNVIDHMLKTDAFSNWLGIQLLETKEGYSKIKMIVREEMLNGLNVVHGGIAFSLADSAFAFACNNRNNLSLALETSISFLKPVFI